MATGDPNRYWERITDLFTYFFGSLALLVVSSAVFGSNFVTSLFALLFSIMLFVGPVGFVYYAYKDKQVLAARYSGVSTRHWLTLSVFMLFTYGLYAVVYALARHYRYDTADGGTAGGGAAGGSTESAVSTVTAAVSDARDAVERGYRDAVDADDGGGDGGTAGGGGTGHVSGGDASRATAPSGDSVEETNVFSTDDDDGVSDTNVYTPGDGSSNGGPGSGGTSGATTFCANCGIDLSAHATASFCPGCGTER